MKKILINGQWQGGADISTLYGAKEIKDLYLRNINYDEAKVSTDVSDLPVENNIVGYRILKTQMEQVFQRLEADQPDKLFTIGGGCDADFPSIAYMNQKYNGNLKILYFDAHGDINSPEESESKLFYGMPLRCLLEESDRSLFPGIDCGIRTQQIIHIGARVMDDAELQFMSKNRIQRLTVKELEKIDFETTEVFDHENIYVHLDLDVIEPKEFPHVPLPESGGIPVDILKKILEMIMKRSCIVGVGIFEYKSCGKEQELLKYLIPYGINF